MDADKIAEALRELPCNWRVAAGAHAEVGHPCCADIGRRCADELEAALSEYDAQPAQTTKPLAEALQVIERYALDGHVMHGDDIERMHAIADKIAPRAAQPVEVPGGWKVQVDVGPEKAVHITNPSGAWIGILGYVSSREQLLADFFRALTAPQPPAQPSADAEAKYRYALSLFDAAAQDGDGMTGIAFSAQVPLELIEGKSASELAEMLCEDAARAVEGDA